MEIDGEDVAMTDVDGEDVAMANASGQDVRINEHEVQFGKMEQPKERKNSEIILK